MFQCPDPGCARTFKSVEDVELHVSVGQHTESVYDRLKREYAVKFSFLTIEGETTTSTETESYIVSSSSFSNLSQGWALHKSKGGAVRFSDKVRQYLISKFEIDVVSGRKEDPGQIAQNIRKAKSENGDRLFFRDQWLTKSQIQGFFSRLFSSRKKKPRPALSTDKDDTTEQSPDQENINHMTIVDAVINEIDLCHPIF